VPADLLVNAICFRNWPDMRLHEIVGPTGLVDVFECILWRNNTKPRRDQLECQLFEKNVLALFAFNPFPQGPPRQIRAVLWQYWFTSMAEKRATGTWWRRQLLGLYAPTPEREPDGTIVVTEWPAVRGRQ
jgi:hypothetical protein